MTVLIFQATTLPCSCDAEAVGSYHGYHPAVVIWEGVDLGYLSHDDAEAVAEAHVRSRLSLLLANNEVRP